MADIFSRRKRSAVMSAIRSRDNEGTVDSFVPVPLSTACFGRRLDRGMGTAE